MSDSPRPEALAGSSHGPLPGAIPIAPVHPAEVFEVNFMLRRRSDGPSFPSPEVIGLQPPRQRMYLTREDFEARHGAHPDDMETIRGFAVAHGFQVIQANAARRTVTLSGTAAQFERALSTKLSHFIHGGGSYRGHQGALHLPEELQSIVTSVIGLDERPIAIPMGSTRHSYWSVDQVARAQAAAADVSYRHLLIELRRLKEKYEAMVAQEPALQTVALEYQRWADYAGHPATSLLSSVKVWTDSVLPSAAEAREILVKKGTDFLADLTGIWTEAERLATLAALDELDIKTPTVVAKLYDFPEGTTGAGQCIGILELGGGYRPEDVNAYFDFCGVPRPDITDVSVGGAKNLPGINEPYDAEVCLDIEVSGASAPEAKLVCYFATLTAKGFIEGVHTAIHDRVNAPSVLSISWDLSEAYWLETPMFIEAFEEVLSEAALVGVTICCSAGDYGSQSEFNDGRAWVDYPASSPHVLGCGGTTLYSRAARIIEERVWDSATTNQQATGGGISQIFPPPAWQMTADVPSSVNPGGGRGRGVPDVAANADPATGYLVQVDGMTKVICGTSSGAPLWSGLLARINQSLGVSVGYINPFLYQSVNQADAFNDIILGGNGVYSARKGWDACTGWGSPSGTNLRDALGVDPPQQPE
jgi:kumamolisin